MKKFTPNEVNAVMQKVLDECPVPILPMEDVLIRAMFLDVFLTLSQMSFQDNDDENS